MARQQTCKLSDYGEREDFVSNLSLGFFRDEKTRSLRPKIWCSFENLSAEWKAVVVKRLAAKILEEQQILGLSSSKISFAELKEFCTFQKENQRSL